MPRIPHYGNGVEKDRRLGMVIHCCSVLDTTYCKILSALFVDSCHPSSIAAIVPWSAGKNDYYKKNHISHWSVVSSCILPSALLLPLRSSSRRQESYDGINH